MPDQTKAIRAFISSTFKDMHAERDHLVTVVFPELRERCGRLGLEFFDVDLRWGVPEKGVDGEKVNSWEYCRRWIDKSEPFFICILGHRYGWVPPVGSLFDANEQALQQEQPRSVTEMEIRRALSHEPDQRHSFFYLRDTLAPAEALAFVDTQENLERIAVLKESIRQCGRPVRDYECEWDGSKFTALRDFGLLVLEDLWSAILRDERYVPASAWQQVLGSTYASDARYADTWKPLPHDLCDQIVALAKPSPKDPLDAEREEMQRFADSRLRWFQGRDNELQQLVDFVESTDANAPRLTVLAAVPGQGKSALMSKLHDELRVHSSSLLVSHFVGATERSSSSYALVKRLLDELDRSGIEFPSSDAATDATRKLDYRSLCQRLAIRLGEYCGEKQIVILIDALNQLDDGHDLHWLPNRLGTSVRLVVSCIEASYQGLDQPQPSGDSETSPADIATTNAIRVFTVLTDRRANIFPLSGLAAEDIRHIVKAYLEEHCKQLDEAHVEAICALPQARNPLYLLVMLNELRAVGGDRMRVIVPALIAAMPVKHPNTISIFMWVLERMEQAEGFGKEEVRWWCLYLAVSRLGMTSRELVDLLRRKFGEASWVRALRIERGLRRYLQRRGDLLDFFHSEFRQAVLKRYALGDTALQTHRELSTYFLAEANPPGPVAWQFRSIHALNEVLFHLLHGQVWRLLGACLKDIFYLQARITSGQSFTLAAELKLALRSLPKDHPDNEVLALLEEALLRDLHFIARHADDYPQALFQSAWNLAIRSPSDVKDRSADLLGALVKRWRSALATAFPDWLWVRFHRSPSVPLGRGRRVVIHPEARLVSDQVQFSSDGSRLLALMKTAAVEWDIETGAEFRRYGCEQGARFTSATYHPDGTHIATSETTRNTRSVRIWDTSTGELAFTLPIPSEVTESPANIEWLAFAPRSDRLLGRSVGGELWCWDLTQQSLAATCRSRELALDGFATYSVFVPLGDGSSVLVHNQHHVVLAWDIDNNTRIHSFQGHGQRYAWCALSEDGSTLVTASSEAIVTHDSQPGFAEHSRTTHDLSYWVRLSSDGRFLAHRIGNRIEVLEASSANKLGECEFTGFPSGLAISPGASHVAASDLDGIIEILSVAKNEVPRESRAYETVFAFSPDGRYVAASLGRGVQIFTGDTFSPVGDPLDLAYSAEWLAWSASGHRVVAAGNWIEFHTFGIPRRDDRWHETYPSMSHSSIATNDVSQVRVLDVPSGEVVGELSFADIRITAVALSPDGSRVAWSANDRRTMVGSCRLIDGLPAIIPEAILDVSRGEGQCLAFSPDGTLLACGVTSFANGMHGRLLVWDVTGDIAERQLLHATLHAGDEPDPALSGFGLLVKEFGNVDWSMSTLKFSQDGKALIVGSTRNPPQKWHIESESCVHSGDVIADPAATLADANDIPHIVISQGTELRVQDKRSGKTMAWIPLSVGAGYPCATPDGRTWGAVASDRLQVFSIETLAPLTSAEVAMPE